jgi:hypothetical protein
MSIKFSLIGTFLRQTLGVTLIALPVLVIFALFYREVLMWYNVWTTLFVLIHSIMIVFCLGRFRSRSFAYIYTRGYSRDELWLNKMIATVISILVVWLPAAVVVWLPIRSVIQDKMFMSPYFPLMMIREVVVPFFWLFGYAVLVPLFHYTWIRRAQPTRGGSGAVLLAIAFVIAAWTLMLFRWHPDWFKIVIWSASAVMTSAGLVGGMLLHRNVEIQK